MAITNQFKNPYRLGTFAQYVGRQPLNLDVGAVLTELDIRFRYTIATGTTAPTGLMFNKALQLAQIAQRIELVVNGQDTVWSIQPWLYVCRLLYERHGTVPYGMQNAINMSASETTYVDFTIPLHFDLIGGRKRNDCAIDLRGIRAAQLYITWGGLSNLFGTPGSTVTLTDQICDVSGVYMQQVPAKDKKGNPIVFGVRQLDEISQPITGANNNLAIDVDQRTGINLISLHTFFDTPSSGVHAGDDSGLLDGSTFQGQMRLVSGSLNFLSDDANAVKARARDDYVVVPAGDTDALVNPEQAGFFPMNIRYDGKLSTGIPTGNLAADLMLQLNENYTSGNTVAYIQREAVRPLQVGP